MTTVCGQGKHETAADDVDLLPAVGDTVLTQRDRWAELQQRRCENSQFFLPPWSPVLHYTRLIASFPEQPG